ncbi:MAG: hypothetical protein ACSHXI_05920 [Hoeflea sp.]|uniref:hypothetical protein n=1 Tax=Hoeflea sp. TaxID=1940281 RepID=UPI003EF3B217
MNRFLHPAYLQLAVVLIFPFLMVATAQLANGVVVAERSVERAEPAASVPPINRHIVLSTSNRVRTNQW